MIRAKFVVVAGLLLGMTSAGGVTAALAQSQPATSPATSSATAPATATATAPTPDATPPAANSPPATPSPPDATPPAAGATATPPAAGAAPATDAGATPPVAPPPPAAETTTNVANPYGLGALWDAGDIVARATLVILVIMSMSSWYVLITKAISQTKILSQGRQVDGTFWKAPTVQQATASMQKGSPFQYIAQTGVDSMERHNDLLDKIDIHTFAESSIQDGVESVQSRMQDGLALLATVGSTAPFVGLFGTVWGIYHALTAIGIAGQASIDKVAGPVGESLIMTAIGLAVAVPAVLGYNFLVRRNKRVVEMSRKFGRKLLFVLLSNAPATSRI
jgi:biopolymer transport protein ExbB